MLRSAPSTRTSNLGCQRPSGEYDLGKLASGLSAKAGQAKVKTRPCFPATLFSCARADRRWNIPIIESRIKKAFDAK